jgi:hypothetical protein
MIKLGGMNKRQLIIALAIMLSLFVVEFIVLMFMIYMSTMPIFLFLFTLALRLFSFFLLGFIVVFLLFTVAGIKPQFTIEWWIMHLHEYTKYFNSIVVISIIAILLSTILGGVLALLTERFFLLPHMKSLNHWVVTHFR